MSWFLQRVLGLVAEIWGLGLWALRLGSKGVIWRIWDVDPQAHRNLPLLRVHKFPSS